MRVNLNNLASVLHARHALWASVCGVAIGFMWYGALVAGPYLRSFG